MANSARQNVINFLDSPETFAATAYAIFTLLLIFVSLITVAVEIKAPSLHNQHHLIFYSFEAVILVVFSIDLITRLICNKNPLKYVTSFYGLVDMVSVIPALIGLFVPIDLNTIWVRMGRIFRALRLFDGRRVIPGLTGRVIPFVLMAMAFKIVTFILEEQAWWISVNNLTVVLGVVGFTLAMLLGAKLATVNGRLYAIEDAVCRIVGALRMLHAMKKVKQDLTLWAQLFEETLRDPKKGRIKQLRHETDSLANRIEAVGIRGPNVAGFHRDVAYVLHRSTAAIPVGYQSFLRLVLFSYTGVVVLVVPGLTGFLAAGLSAYVMIGVHLLIEDLDSPLDFSPYSLITADLEPLSQFNKRATLQLESPECTAQTCSDA